MHSRYFYMGSLLFDHITRRGSESNHRKYSASSSAANTSSHFGWRSDFHDLKSDVQAFRESDADKHNSVMSCSETSVATLRKGLADWALTHQPIKELWHTWVSVLSVLYQVFLRTFVNCCMRASVRLSRKNISVPTHCGKFQVQKIQTDFETVQEQKSEILDSETRKFVLWLLEHTFVSCTVISEHHNSKSTSSAVQFDSLVESATNIQWMPKFGGERSKTVYFVETPECHQLLCIVGELLEFVRRIHAGHTTNCSDAWRNTCDARECTTVSVARQDALHVDVQRHKLWPESQRRSMQ